MLNLLCRKYFLKIEQIRDILWILDDYVHRVQSHNKISPVKNKNVITFSALLSFCRFNLQIKLHDIPNPAIYLKRKYCN